MLEAEDLLRRATAPDGAAAAMPRCMVVMAHADDETIALGARMGRFHEAHFIHVTDGAPRNEQDSRAHGFSALADYRDARLRELAEMFRIAGIERVSRSSLRVPDQEAALNLVGITRQLIEHIARYEPDVIFTHPYEGGHPDHDACAFAVHHAVGLHRAGGGKRPLIVEAPFYNAGPKELGSSGFLDVAMTMPKMIYSLSPAEKERKHKLIACFTTQTETLKGFQDAKEQYRIAPMYDFTHMPHEGKIHYDNYPWGMTSDRFCELAAEAESQLNEGSNGV